MVNTAEIFQRAVQCHREGDLAAAEKLYGDVCALEPQNGQAHHLRGVAAYQQGRFEEAIAILRQALALMPSAADCWNNLGLAWAAAGNHPEAMASFREALRHNPQLAEANHNLANALLLLQQVPLAISHYQEALRLKPRYAEALCGLGAALAAQQQFADAQTQLSRALDIHPDFVEAHCHLAHVLCKLNRPHEAVAHCQHALSLRPDSGDALRNLGSAFLLLGEWQKAHATFSRALQLDNRSAMAHFGLGYVHEMQNELGAAIDCYRRAVSLHPDYADAHYQMANVFMKQDGVTDAVNHFREAIRILPQFSPGWNNLACALARKGDLEEAIAALQQAIRLSPGYAEAFCNLGNAFLQAGNIAAALECSLEAIRLNPHHSTSHFHLALVQQAMGDWASATASFRQALCLQPQHPEALFGLGELLLLQGQFDEALGCFERALALHPHLAEAQANYAAMLAEQGNLAQAEPHFREAIRLEPTPRKEILAGTRLPVIYQSSDEVLEWRRRLTDNVRALRERGVTADLGQEMAVQCFYAVYQGLNDRELQADLAALYVPPPTPTRRARPPRGHGGNKIRVGFVSRYLMEHTIGRLFGGLISKLSKQLFHVSVLSIGNYGDAVANRIRQQADAYVPLPPTLAAARQVIADQHLDVLFYTDIGMEPMAYSLAFSRLAPVQTVTWGHPVTTGIPTVDYFVSGESLETPESEDHYTEALVRLKYLPIYYFRPATSKPLNGRSFFGLPESKTLYLCPQSLFKFHPEFDEILGGILRRDRRGLLVLLQGRQFLWQQLLLQRFAVSMPDVVDRVVFLPSQDHAHFMNLYALADVVLDPLHFGGGNTSYEALALAAPVVTFPSPFLRGRITLALYKQMSMMDCVVASPGEYIDLAVKLGVDSAYRAEIKAKILASKDALFENEAGVRELEAFFQQAVVKAGKN